MPSKRNVWLYTLAVITAIWLPAAPADDREQARDTGTKVLRFLAREDARFEQALAIRQQGRIAEAYDLLANLLRDYPADEKVNFAFGVLAMERGRTSLGSLAFERVLTMNPDNDRARLELARAYYLTGQWEQSRLHFNRVLERDPPDTVRTTIGEYIRGIKRNQPGWKAHTQTEVGAIYDSNINFGPKREIIGIDPITIGGIRFDELQIDPSTRSQSAWGGFASANLRAFHDTGAVDGWSFECNLRAYGNFMIDATEYNISGIQLGGGPRYRRNKHAFRAPLRLEYIHRDDKALATMTGFHPLHMYRYTHQCTFTTRIGIEHRNFAGGSDRDGFMGAIHEQITLLFGNRQKHRTDFGLRLGREFAEAAIYRNTLVEGNLRLTSQITPHTSVFGEATARYRQYEDREPLAPRTRRDIQWGVASGINRQLTARFHTNLRVQYTENESTFNLYDYARYTATWSLNHAY